MKCIVYAKQAFLNVSNSEIVILKSLQKVGSSALKFRLCTLCCLILCLFEREQVLCYQGECYPLFLTQTLKINMFWRAVKIGKMIQKVASDLFAVECFLQSKFH